MFGSSNRTIIQTQTSKTTQKWVTEHKTKLLLRPFQSSDLNPVEHEWGELKKHRHGDVNLKGLEWFWMKEWSLISCQVFSNLIRHYRRKLELLNWQINGGFKKYWIKGCVNCGQFVLDKNIYFIMIFPLILNSYYSNERFDFCDFLK